MLVLDKMVLDLKLKGLSGRRGLMFVPYYGRSGHLSAIIDHGRSSIQMGGSQK